MIDSPSLMHFLQTDPPANRRRDNEHEEIRQLIADFLVSGGTITLVESGAVMVRATGVKRTRRQQVAFIKQRSHESFGRFDQRIRSKKTPAK